MSDVDPKLLEQAKQYVENHLDIAGGAQPEEIVRTTLEFFTRDEEWQSLAYDDCSGTYEDDHSKVYGDVDALLAALGTLPFSPARVLRHRFVLSTDWDDVYPHLDWRPRGA